MLSAGIIFACNVLLLVKVESVSALTRSGETLVGGDDLLESSHRTSIPWKYIIIIIFLQDG